MPRVGANYIHCPPPQWHCAIQDSKLASSSGLQVWDIGWLDASEAWSQIYHLQPANPQRLCQNKSHVQDFNITSKCRLALQFESSSWHFGHLRLPCLLCLRQPFMFLKSLGKQSYQVWRKRVSASALQETAIVKGVKNKTKNYSTTAKGLPNCDI